MTLALLPMEFDYLFLPAVVAVAIVLLIKALSKSKQILVSLASSAVIVMLLLVDISDAVKLSIALAITMATMYYALGNNKRMKHLAAMPLYLFASYTLTFQLAYKPYMIANIERIAVLQNEMLADSSLSMIGRVFTVDMTGYYLQVGLPLLGFCTLFFAYLLSVHIRK